MADFSEKLKLIRSKVNHQNKESKRNASPKTISLNNEKPHSIIKKTNKKYLVKAISNISKINTEMKLEEYLECTRHIHDENLLPSTRKELEILQHYNNFFETLKGSSNISTNAISRIIENSLRDGYKEVIEYKFRNHTRKTGLAELHGKALRTSEMIEDISKMLLLPKYAKDGIEFDEAIVNVENAFPYVFEAIYKSSSIEKIIKMSDKWSGGDKDHISSIGYICSKEFKWQNITEKEIAFKNGFSIKEINNQKELNSLAQKLGNCIASKYKDCLSENPNLIFEIKKDGKTSGAIQAEYSKEDECFEVSEHEDNQEYETGAYLEMYINRFIENIEIDNSLKNVSEYKDGEFKVNIDLFKKKNNEYRKIYDKYELELGYVPYGEEGDKSHFYSIKNHREYLGSGREKHIKNMSFQKPDLILKSLITENGKSILSLYNSNFENRIFPKIEKAKQVQSVVS